jgi:hypothetical protein
VDSGDILISADTRARLGGAEIAEVMASLWPVDCQSCGLPLGAAATVLAVDQAGPAAWASLHHRRCREPGWEDPPVIDLTAGNQTYRSRLVLTPGCDLDLPAPPGQILPVMIVNPSLECVRLRQAGRRWQPHLDEDFTAAGLTPPGPGFALRQPVPGAAAALTASSAVVTLRSRPGLRYESWFGQHPLHTLWARREITAQGGIMLAVSHAFYPDAASDLPRQLGRALRTGTVLLGWAALTAPAPPARLRSRREGGWRSWGWMTRSSGR